MFCDGRVSQTMCFAMVESVKLLSLSRFGMRIRVTQANLAFCFFREKANSLLSARGQKVQKTFKSDTATLEFELGGKSPSLRNGDPRNSMGSTRLGRTWG